MLSVQVTCCFRLFLIVMTQTDQHKKSQVCILWFQTLPIRRRHDVLTWTDHFLRGKQILLDRELLLDSFNFVPFPVNLILFKSSLLPLTYADLSRLASWEVQTSEWLVDGSFVLVKVSCYMSLWQVDPTDPWWPLVTHRVTQHTAFHSVQTHNMTSFHDQQLCWHCLDLLQSLPT